jgi:hypothetical protein
VKGHALQAASAKRGKPVVVLQAPELTLDRDTAPVETLEPTRVATDAREQATAKRERQGHLIGLGTPEWNDRFAPAFFDLGIDAGYVVSLVHGDGLGLEAASVERVDERGYELRFVVPCGLHPPREREARSGADSGLQLVPVVPAALAGADRGAMPPRGVRVAEPLALFASLADVALTIRVCGRSEASIATSRPKSGY